MPIVLQATRGDDAIVAAGKQETFMGINKDQVEGRVKEAAGKVQETAGKAVGNTTQQVKGSAHKVAGAAQAAYGDVKENVKDNLKDANKRS
jgi:uncharacterized protein YjbJ (UPF0337 family)